MILALWVPQNLYRTKSKVVFHQVHLETCSWLFFQSVRFHRQCQSTDEFLPCFIHQAADASWHYASCCGGARRQLLDSLRQPPTWSLLSRWSSPASMWIPTIYANWNWAEARDIPCPICRKSAVPVARDWKRSLRRCIQILPTSWCSNPEWRCELWERVGGGRQSWTLIFPCCRAPICRWKICVWKEELRSLKMRLQVVNPKCRTSHLWVAVWNLRHLMRNSRLWQRWRWQESRIHLQVHGRAGWSFGMQHWPSRSMTVVCTVALSWNKVLTSTSRLPSQSSALTLRASSCSTSLLTFNWKRLTSLAGRYHNSTTTLHSTWC